MDSFSVIVKEWGTNLFDKDIINKTKRIMLSLCGCGGGTANKIIALSHVVLN